MMSRKICGPRETVLSGFKKADTGIFGKKNQIPVQRLDSCPLDFGSPGNILDAPASTPLQDRTGQPGMAPMPIQSVRVLVAEDSPEQQLLIKYYMNAFPFMVEFASDGMEVVDKFQRDPFPFVFMDMRMPKMDGLAATRAIRRMESVQKRFPAQIIALTGLCRDSDLEAIRQAGCDGILPKPYTKLQFMRKIKEILHIP